jgi:hypothetical protein
MATIKQKSVDAIIFNDNSIPEDATVLVDLQNDREFDIASCMHIQEDGSNVIRSRVTIKEVTEDTLNTGIDQIDITHNFTYRV